METSAKANINIEKAFCELAEAILDQTAGKEGNNADNQQSTVMIDRKNADKSLTKGCC
jgi:Ras-related protein Rab-10